VSLSSDSTVVALLHPGAMGARVGAELVSAGHQVRWLSAERSPATWQRATDAGLAARADVETLLDGAEIVLSVCPPQGAADVAKLIAGAGFSGIYVDANPVAPETLTEIAADLVASDATLVDGGIVGPPPGPDRRTNLYLAGDQAATQAVADLFADTHVTAMVVGAEVGAASAAKQAYALFNKGRIVLAAAAADLAESYGVLDVLAGEGERSGADILAQLPDVRSGLTELGWRWGPEFAEIATAIAASGADPALARACEQLLRRYHS
jgi:3-hydroxyisobutyrate dehydrogenase-like beta-hydroxyacid dehydrogenase